MISLRSGPREAERRLSYQFGAPPYHSRHSKAAQPLNCLFGPLHPIHIWTKAWAVILLQNKACSVHSSPFTFMVIIGFASLAVPPSRYWTACLPSRGVNRPHPCTLAPSPGSLRVRNLNSCPHQLQLHGFLPPQVAPVIFKFIAQF